MKKLWTGIGIVFIGTLALVGGCVGGSSEDPQEMQIKTYRLPEGQDMKEVRDYLNRSLDTGDQNLGQVATYPDGSLVVTAPVSIHVGIEDLIEQLAQQGPKPAEPVPASVTIDYWVVLGRPGQTGVNIASPTLKQNQELRPVFEEIVRTQGGMEFHLLEQLQLKSLDNRSSAEIRGRLVYARQKVMMHDSGQRLADILP